MTAQEQEDFAIALYLRGVAMYGGMKHLVLDIGRDGVLLQEVGGEFDGCTFVAPYSDVTRVE